MSLVLLAILVAIWASILVPLLRRERATWPGGRRPVVHGGPPTPARGGPAVWRLEPESMDRIVGESGRTRSLVAIDGGRDDDLPEEPAGSVVLGPVARWGRAEASEPRHAPAGRRAVFLRRRQVLVALAAAAVAAAVPALLAGGSWWWLALAAWLLLAAYLVALAFLARRRHAAARPGRADSGPAPASSAGPRLTAVPAAPE